MEKSNKNIKKGNWDYILYGKKFLNEDDAVKIRAVMKEFRKEYDL